MNIESDIKIDTSKKNLFIFDNHNLLYKSYFAVPKFHDNHGRPTGAIQGALSIVFKFLNKYPNAYYCVASDSKGGNFRHQLFPEYKAHRKEIEDELLKQIMVVPNFYRAIGINFIAEIGFEADDIIASLVKKFSNEYVIYIVSSDKDLMQLVGDNVFSVDPTKDILFDQDEVVKKFGVFPNQIHDYLSLIGDASDNIPGAKSVGPKTALKILKYGNLDNILQNPSIIDDKKLYKLIDENRENIILSQKLVALNHDMNIDSNEEFALNLSDIRGAMNLLGEYNLNALQKMFERIVKKFGDDSGDSDNTNHHYDDVTEYRKTISSRAFKEIEECGLIAVEFHEGKFYFAFKGVVYEIDDAKIAKTILESAMIKKVVYNYRKIANFVENNVGFYDLSIIYYHIFGTKANYDILDILYFEQIDYKQAANYVVFYEELYRRGLKKLFDSGHIEYLEVDRKISKILQKMENNGILVCKNRLRELSEYFDGRLHDIKEKIIDISGYDFNVLSPKQTSDILFNKLEICPTKKTKNEGTFSTSQQNLEELSDQGFEIADHILQYRSIYKLKSSYADSLINDINEVTGRIHTEFELNGAATGRILSSKPNLQNIPTKTEEGRKIRSCFVAEEGKLLISADYSQVELRILAHIADVQNLKKAFDDGIDIHQLTASKIFGISFDKIDDFWRSKAKAVNFGIIYGISAFGLSKQLKITNGEASEIIKNYLSYYHEINDYIEKTKNFASQNGYVKTIFGRNCYIRQQLSDGTLVMPKNVFEKQFFERAAINAPIQGSASDIIKFAMIKINKMIDSEVLRAKLLLQIHDELIFEVEECEVIDFEKRIKTIMESICDEINLNLSVNASHGKNWMDL